MRALTPTEAIIVEAVRRSGFSAPQITGDDRRRCVVYVRDAVTWAISTTLDLSNARIGRILGNRDHSTVISALRRAARRRESDDGFRTFTDALVAVAEAAREAQRAAVAKPETAKTQRGDGHGPTPAEREVLDLWDAGDSIQAIAVTLDCEEQRVRNIVSTYHIRPTRDFVTFENMARAGSAALLAAITATGRSFA